jgi:hypothetical protein
LLEDPEPESRGEITIEELEAPAVEPESELISALGGPDSGDAGGGGGGGGAGDDVLMWLYLKRMMENPEFAVSVEEL